MAAKRHALARRRRAMGFSQEALASRLDVERSTVARWECGETEPLPWIRPVLAQALRVSIDELAGLLSAAVLPGPAGPPGTAPGLARLRPSGGSSRPETTAASSAGAADRESPSVSQLPPAVADFTGREAQIAQLTEMLSHDRDRVGVPVAVLSGPPGVGKTALALQAAHMLRPEFPDGQMWVPLEGVTGHARDPGEILGGLARALDVSGQALPKSTAERGSLYRSLLAGRRVLVLADDATSAAQVRPLLPGSGQCAVLITSRCELAGPPGARLIPLAPFTPAESVQLLTKIIGQRRVAAEPFAAVELGAACGQLPLALRIAASRLAARPGWPLAAFARKIIYARRPLGELDAGEVSVRASFAQSYHALDEPAQRAFRRLALLDDGEITEWQVAALLDTPGATEVVNQLADQSLLTSAGIDPSGQARYRLHDLLRDYAAERLDDDPQPERDAALTRVVDGWLRMAASTGYGSPGGPSLTPPALDPTVPVLAAGPARATAADLVAWTIMERLSVVAVAGQRVVEGRYHAAGQLAPPCSASGASSDG
jgi:predicted ATPase/DNA-binding XRE family transcriptional regulator